MTAAAMDDDAFRAFRKIGLPEEIAAKVARVIRRDRGDDEFVTKTDRETEREAARAVREAERAADREAFAARDDVTVLQTEMTDVKTAFVRIDKRFERIDARLDRMDARLDRMDQTIVEIKETAARTDEKINSLQAQNKIFIIPLLFLTFGALVGLLTKGVLWGVAP